MHSIDSIETYIYGRSKDLICKKEKIKSKKKQYKKVCLKISLREYSLMRNKHNQKLVNILESQKIYGGFLKILIFRVSLSRTHSQSKTFLFTKLQILKSKIKTFPLGKSLFKLRNKETIV